MEERMVEDRKKINDVEEKGGRKLMGNPLHTSSQSTKDATETIIKDVGAASKSKVEREGEGRGGREERSSSPSAENRGMRKMQLLEFRNAFSMRSQFFVSSDSNKYMN